MSGGQAEPFQCALWMMTTEYNQHNIGVEEDTILDKSLFQDPDFVEVYRIIGINMRIESTEHDPLHPSRPRLNFRGDIGGVNTMIGQVLMTKENEICWSFVRNHFS